MIKTEIAYKIVCCVKHYKTEKFRVFLIRDNVIGTTTQENWKEKGRYLGGNKY
jgi:hypothetical protein